MLRTTSATANTIRPTLAEEESVGGVLAGGAAAVSTGATEATSGVLLSDAPIAAAGVVSATVMAAAVAVSGIATVLSSVAVTSAAPVTMTVAVGV